MCCNEGLIIRVIGCHGTTRTNARSICTTKCFLSSGSEKDWLGSGVYFYDNNREAAYAFCKSVKRIADEDIVVVTATIDSVFYFNLLEMEHYNLFSESVKRFRERVSKLKNAKCYPKILDGHVLEAICKENLFDFVYAAFNVNNNYKRAETRIVNPNIIDSDYNNVLCVKNAKCILRDTIRG